MIIAEGKTGLVMDSNPSRIIQNPFLFVLGTGLLVGTLDIAAALISAFIQNGATPQIVFQYIASGVFGKSAFSGGWAMALWGCFFHYCIATGWTLLFFVVYPKIALFSRYRLITGILYGLFIWLMMNRIVLPLSNVSMKPQTDVSKAGLGIFILMTMIGIPLSILVNKYYAQKKAGL